ncbi:MAG: ABC transporter [Candidatus Rokuibacteriota bacterium]|nr:MAG: ABC transporter [Candidatus Rokubacteria bacterium]PYO18272.1 MAG: ABC transporter [Candidatus Rokubacteria bacterium]
MRNFLPLLMKEEKAVFSSPIAYAIIAVYLLLMGYTFTLMLFLNRTAELVRIFFQAAVLFLLIVPVITMRLLAEERRSGTLELLLTSPVREFEIVLAKFAASVTMIALMLLLTASHAVVLGIYAEPDWGPIYSGFLGLFLLAGALSAVGLLVSGLTANQIVAAVIAMGIGILMWMIDSIGYLLPDPFDTIVTSLSFVAHFTPFATGALFLSDLGFFLTVMLACLLLSVRTLARR